MKMKFQSKERMKMETAKEVEAKKEKLENSELTTILITGAKKGEWYDEMVGNRMLVKLYKSKRAARCYSMPDLWLKDGDFKVIKGKDIRYGGEAKLTPSSSPKKKKPVASKITTGETIVLDSITDTLNTKEETAVRESFDAILQKRKKGE